MKLHTENLTVLFVDIVGYTAATSRHSRTENADLLKSFNETLVPIVHHFRGKKIKSIGDAMLLTFRSPTDAMLCSMAMQDAMHQRNLQAPGSDPIHIRVAANLGEVRVTRNDIFGEPVNIASRIEGVAPADEIYLSEAVYMAMNKAEVPAAEVGQFTLKGMEQPVKLYNIPRFATHRLVPQNAHSAESGSELLFPYGGMHLGSNDTPAATRTALFAGAAVLAVVMLGTGAWWWLRPAPAAVAVSAPAAPVAVPAEQQSAVTTPEPQSAEKAAQETSKESEATVAKPATKPAAKPPKSAASPRSAPMPSNIAAAKRAYRDRRISREQYRAVVNRLESDYDQRVRALKVEYRARRMSREQYGLRVDALKRQYYGE
ncbi:MAG TPA: adenylate/guanylate cyclase domain-containing protein [Pseudomonadales bacterium]|jgi:class 3 adenylate cyclase|nr:adenylate/guanylate cyclase domain-containing protein [Pseudomonadales bacterium]